MPDLLTIDQLSARIGVPKSTIYQWNYRGTGPKRLKLAGGVVRYRVEDVETWLAAQEVAS